MQVVDKLSAVLTEKNISVLKFSNESGISAYRVYKWLDKKGSPKHEDSKKIEEWLRNLDPVEQEAIRQGQDAMTYTPITTSDRSLTIVAPSEKDRLIQDLKDRNQKLEEQVGALLRQSEQLMKMLDKSLEKS